MTNPSGVWTTTGTSSAAGLEFEDGVVWLLAAGPDAAFDAEASGVRPSAMRKTEVIQVTAIAVPSAMRIRTAPPFVGRRGARLCSVEGGLRPLHTRPDRRAGRHRPIWHIAAGCAAGCVKPGDCPRCVLFSSSAGSPEGQARRNPDWSVVCPTGTTFCIQLICTPQHEAESPISLCAEQCSRMVSNTGFAPSHRTLTWTYGDRDCDVVHKIGFDGAYLPLLIPLNGPANSGNEEPLIGLF